jgi:hypothetical protein
MKYNRRYENKPMQQQSFNCQESGKHTLEKKTPQKIVWGKTAYPHVEESS